MQTVKLDKLIKLFDSPGIVMSKETNPASLILRNCVRVTDINTTTACFLYSALYLRRLKQLMIHYQPLSCYFINVQRNR